MQHVVHFMHSMHSRGSPQPPHTYLMAHEGGGEGVCGCEVCEGRRKYQGQPPHTYLIKATGMPVLHDVGDGAAL